MTVHVTQHAAMRIPSTLKIGGHAIAVIIKPEWEAETIGEYRPDKGEIWLLEGLPPSIAASTMLHEAMHVMNATIDHELLDSLSEQVYAFLSDNGLVK